jgi:hypothetical protein
MKTLNNTKLIILLFAIVISACQPTTQSNEKAATEPSVFFKNIQTGAILSSPFLVEMGVEGMEVEKAGMINELKGHHHIIINSNFIADGDIVPANAQHIHFGGGQTETQLDLEAGNYSLTLQFADGMHQSYGEKMSKTINVTVR